MHYLFTGYSLFFLSTAFVSFFTAFLSWQRRSVNSAKELTLVMIASGLWSFFLIFEAAAPTVAQKLIWSKLAYAGAVTTPVFYLLFVLRYTARAHLVTSWQKLALFAVPLITFLLTATNDKHHLIWSGFSDISPLTNLMEYYHGYFFWIGYFGYNNVILLIATILLFSFVIHHSRPFKAQGFTIIVAGLCPWSAGLIYLAGANPVDGLDLVPASIILSGFLMVISILYRRFLDLAPVARNTLMETLQDGIIALDLHNRIQDINEAARTFLGITHEHIIGGSIRDTASAVIPLRDAILSESADERLEIGTSSATRHFRVIKQPILKQPGSRLVIIRDITEQIAHQMVIREGEYRYRHLSALFRLMADNMPDMLWAKDLDKRFIFTNKSICENLLHATDTDEPIGKTDLFFASRERERHPDDPDWHTFGEQCQDSDEVVLKTGQPKHFDEFGNVNKRFLYLAVRKAPIVNDQGKMIGVVGSARDVTIQKKNEAELLKKDTLLDAIAKATAFLVREDDFNESINRALEIIGKATGVNRVYIFRNHNDPAFRMPLMSQIYEWSDGTVEKQIDNPDLQDLPYEMACPRWFHILSAGNTVLGNIRDFPEPEKSALEAQAILSILSTPIIIDHQFWGFVGFDDCKNERIWSHVEERILSAAANTIGAAFMRKKNQDALVAAKLKAEESDRLKSAFLTNMSHEIRTPMNGILGFISLLQEPDLTGEEKEQYINIVKKSGERLLSTIHDIIDISKIEAGQMVATRSSVNVNEMTANLFAFFQKEAELKGLELSIERKLPDIHAMVETDRDMLNSILTNLIKNALKYTKQGRISLGYDHHEGQIHFFVKDTGIGIPADKREIIFERFVQADVSHTRFYEGSGLGLSISKAYVEMLDGAIWLESEENKGSTFHFSIPCMEPPRHDDSPHPEQAEPLKTEVRPMRILVVEDDQVNYEFIHAILKKKDHQVLHAETGVAAIEFCKKDHAIDLVFMDIKMPGMDGFEATIEIRKFNPSIPIIALTAFAMQGDPEKAIEAGCSGYLSKPVRKADLLSCISGYA